MLNKKIERYANQILDDLGMHDLPIQIEQIAKKRGVKIQKYDLGQDVSGVLVIEKGVATIGVNQSNSKVRQRFTIAHELAHYELHRQIGDLFIDKEYKIYFRDAKSAFGEDIKEMEANAFAAAILMPKGKLVEEIQNNKFELTDDAAIKKLADIFGVSSLSMTFRISNLNLF